MKKKSPKGKAPKRRQKRAIDKKTAFLAAFISCANLTEAAAAVVIDRSLHYQWLKSDPRYPERYREACLQAGDTLKDDAVAWARKGIFEPLVYQGQFQYAQRERVICTLPGGKEVCEEDLPKGGAIVESRRKVVESYGPPLGIWRRSEGLTARLLKAFLPDEFGDRGALELSGANGGPITVSLAEVLRDRRAKREGHDQQG